MKAPPPETLLGPHHPAEHAETLTALLLVSTCTPLLPPMPKLPKVSKLLQWLLLQDQPLTPREKARTLVQALDEATHACLREQAHIMGYALERNVALNQLAISFAESDWCPKGLAREDIEMIGYGWIADVVWAIANGHSLSAYEIKIHELFRLKAEGQTLPPVRPQRDGRESSRLSPRPRSNL